MYYSSLFLSWYCPTIHCSYCKVPSVKDLIFRLFDDKKPWTRNKSHLFESNQELWTAGMSRLDCQKCHAKWSGSGAILAEQSES